MRFEELEEKYQEFLMYSILDYIKWLSQKETIADFIEITYDEYKAFFGEV